MRSTLRLLAVLLCALVAAPAAATAAPATTTNACLWSIDGVWRDQDVTIAGTAAPNPVGPGGGVGLRSGTIAARLPDEVAEIGYNFGLLKAGANELPSRVWVAIAGEGSTQGVQVHALNVRPTTTITVDGEARFVSATPIDVAIPLPDTAWTAPASGALTFRQAAAGTLPPLPVGSTGQDIAVGGSLYIHTTIGSSTRISLDCRPGTATPAGDGFLPAPSNPFDTVAVQDGAPAPPAPPALPALPRGALAVDGATIPVRLSCPAGGAACEGTARVATASRVRLGGRRAVVRIAARAYDIAAGRRATVRLRLTAGGTRLLRTRGRVAVRLEAGPPSGNPASRRLTLRAGPGPSVAPRAALSGGRAVLRVACPARGGACEGTVALISGRTVAARGRYAVRAGRTRDIRVALTSAGRALGAGTFRAELTPASPAPPVVRRVALR